MSVFNEQGTSNDRSTIRSVRNRRPISCLPCRHRKLKCDRSLPACSNCVNRGDITACSYVSRKPEPRPTTQQPSDLPEAAQRKIDHLERLVLTLLKNQQHQSEQIDSDNNEIDNRADLDQNNLLIDGDIGPTGSRPMTNLENSNNAIKISADYKQSLSVDEAHWALLLNEIGDVRSHLKAQHKQYEEQTKKISQLFRRSSDDPGPTLLFGSARNMRRVEILSQLPSKYSCDILVSRFFSHLYPAIYILHGPTFQKQYESFWNDEASTSIVWVAILFAMLRISMQDYVREGDEPVEYKGKCQDLAVSFRNRFTDCLILADYMRPHEFLIEALILHLYAEYVSSRDSKSSVWVLVGMIVRMAMRTGYHQVSQPALSSTPFQTEMRRRAWAFIRQADILISFQVGLPSMIGLRSLECPLPRNINDDENFTEHCTVLPPALPDSEPTQISYLIAKTKLAFGFARALEQINSDVNMQWEKILEIDRELREIYNSVPNHYKVGPLSSQDSLVLVSARFVLASIHHKSLCVIHSRFLEIGRSDFRYQYSRRVCLNSAMTILRFQAIQNQEMPVDGRLRSMTNYQTSLAIHDYLLAATILSADICSTAPTANLTSPQPSHGIPTRTEMLKALEISARIFRQMRDQSMEAYKAADVLEMLVRKFEAEEPTTAASRRTEFRRFKAVQSSRPEENRQNSNPASSKVFQSPNGKPTSSTNLNATINSSDSILPRVPQHLVSRSSRMSHDANIDGSNMENPGAVEGTNLDAFSSWPDFQESGVCFPSLAYPHMLPELEPSVNWNVPASMDASSTAGSPVSSISGNANIAPYSGTLDLNDPMSALWQMNSGSRGDFHLT